MTAGGFVLVFGLVFALGVPLVLWALVNAETDDTDVMDRQRAEESARADRRTAVEDRADDQTAADRSRASWTRRDADDGSDRRF
ncbi:hypothetical protein BV210_03990 [Halorientalis sp. IM1011]|uniref:hypothetical protein n=1 Tax=Halorientalis sp. IM1011 TaxID=1932360 RepID=UPI00097CC68C|nr:hypothetical protein [Halorientalis sp. IM1011]AQL41926.1 hypothetical protein BV210_03990 [Halorientalis sp. IM1011]